MGYITRVRVQATQIYLDWINSLRDRTARARIQMRVDRLFTAILDSTARSLPVSASSRLMSDPDIGCVLRRTLRRGGHLAGGDKSTQQQDIRAALALAKDLRS